MSLTRAIAFSLPLVEVVLPRKTRRERLMRALYPVSILFVVMTAIASISSSRAQTGLEATAHGIIDSVRDVLLGRS